MRALAQISEVVDGHYRLQPFWMEFAPSAGFPVEAS
jgi:hypothetical protein